MTPQEAYDGIRTYFSRPRARLAEEGSLCVYRWGSKKTAKTRCAAGCLIPDELYDPEMEGYVILEVSAIFSDVGEYLGEAVTFVSRAHDTSGSVAGFLEDLDRLARDFGLEVAP